jgi:hypothetical protein
LLKYLFPLGWELIHLTGDYQWKASSQDKVDSGHSAPQIILSEAPLSVFWRNPFMRFWIWKSRNRISNEIGAKVSKLAAYIATRARLTQLIPTIVEAFYAEEIGVGQVLLLSKLQPNRKPPLQAAFVRIGVGSREGEAHRPSSPASPY